MACRFFSCVQALSYDMRDLVPWPGIEPGPPALGAQRLSHWTKGSPPRSFILDQEPAQERKLTTE